MGYGSPSWGSVGSRVHSPATTVTAQRQLGLPRHHRERTTHVESDGHGGPTSGKHRVVASLKAAKFAGEGVLERYAAAERVVRVEHDRDVEVNVFHVATAVAHGVRAIRLLRDQDTTKRMTGASSQVQDALLAWV